MEIYYYIYKLYFLNIINRHTSYTWKIIKNINIAIYEYVQLLLGTEYRCMTNAYISHYSSMI